MELIKDGTGYKSKCGKYKITKHGDQYCLWTKKFNIFCLMLSMGTLDEVKNGSRKG